MFACEKDADEFFTFLDSHQPNIKFPFEKEKDNKIAFLDICINIINHGFCASVFRKSTSIGLYTNFSSFAPFSYKIKTLINRTCSISSSWDFFHDEIKNTKHLMEKNMYPYIGEVSVRIKKKMDELCKRISKKTDINIVLTPFKIGCLFSSKDMLPNALRFLVVYKFTCAGCQSCYIGETRCHLATRMKEHLVTDKKSHIMKHLLEKKTCKSLCDEGCFQVIDYASTPFRLRVKEAF